MVAFAGLLLGPGIAGAQVLSGSYVGDDTAGHRITGLRFQPDAVIVKSDSSDDSVMRTSTMAGNVTKVLINSNAIATNTNMITSLDPDGFTVGNHANVNSGGTTYYWTAFKANANVAVSSYTGNGLVAGDTQGITVGFQPDYVIILGAGARWPLHRTNLGGTLATRFNGSGYPINDAITSLAAPVNGFTVMRSAAGSVANSQNFTGETYHYVAWNAVAGQMAVGQYDGNAADNRNITPLGFRPGYMIVGSITAALSPHQRSNQMGGDKSYNFQSGSATDMIQDFLADGFQVGTDLDVNGNIAAPTIPNCTAGLPCTYTWAAFAGPTINYRSIGTNSGTLASGTGTVALGSSTVSLAGGTCLSGNVGLGDKLTFTGAPAETLYILSRNSRNNVTVQGAASSAHAGQTYTITRAFGGLTALPDWETAQGGDLVAGSRIEVGVAYNDGPFTAGLTISGNTTDATHYMKLTAEPFQRHTGVAGTGVVLDGNDLGGNGISVQDDYTVVEWFELTRHKGADGSSSLEVGSATGVLLQHLLVHDFDSATTTVVGIKANANSVFTVRNSIFYDGGGPGQPAAIRGTNGPNTVTVQNCSIYGIVGRGVYADDTTSTFNVVNTIAVSDTVKDFDAGNGTLTQSYNLSTDTSATGTGSLTGRTAANQFRNTTAGFEDLHLNPGADAVDRGTDLFPSTGFTDDLDGDGRPGISTAWDIGADEGTTFVYRSIGMNAGTIYGTGTASNTATTRTVDFIGASLPVNVGQGDVLTFTSGTAETLYILSRDSATRVTVQSAAVNTHAGANYTITRAFSGTGALQAWETARQGNLVAANKTEVGVVYADAPFVYNLGNNSALEIKDSITSPQCYMKITVPRSQRHNGIAGAGVVLDGGPTPPGPGTKFGVNATDNYSVVEWLELTNFHGASLAGAVSALGSGRKILFNGLLIHDFFDGANAATGIRVFVGNPIPVSFTVRNCIVYNGDVSGIHNGDCDSNITVQNSTVYNMHATPGRGVYADVGPVTATNTISMSNTSGSFVANGGNATIAQSNNMSSDGTAGGAGSLGGRVAANQFVSLTAGSENLHLKAGSEAIDAGTNLQVAGRFADDVDGQGRPGGTGWDMGADEFNDIATVVTLDAFLARGRDGGVDLTWSTASELSNLGFHLYRSPAADGPYVRITSALIPGLGSSPMGQTYSYSDTGLTNGVTWFYELEDIDTSGGKTRHGPVWATPSPGGGDGGGSPGDGGGAPSPGGGPIAGRIAYGSPAPTSIRVLSRDDREAVLELLTPGFFATPNADGSSRLEIPGFEVAPSPGAPALPLRRTWLEVAAGRGVVVDSVSEAEVLAFPDLRPMATPAHAVALGRAGTVTPADLPRPESAAFRDLYPSQVARIPSVGFQRERKKALIEMSPLRWDGATGRLLLARRLRVRVAFSGTETGEVPSSASLGQLPSREITRQRSPVVELLARGEGLHAVPFEDVFPRDQGPVPAGRLELGRRGLPVAFHLEPDPSTFGPGSRLYFVSDGAQLDPDGAAAAVYELSLGLHGVSMPVVEGLPDGTPTSYYWAWASREENRYYQAGLTDAPQLWLWDVLVSPVVKSYPLALHGLAPAPEPAHLRVFLQGASDYAVNPDHHVRAYVNDVFVAEASWDGRLPLTLEGDIPPGVLREGDNRLDLENVGDTPADYSMVFLDRFEVRYPRGLVAEGGVLEGDWSQAGLATVAGLGASSSVLDVTSPTPSWRRGGLATAAGLAFHVEAGRRYLAVSPEGVLRPDVKRCFASGLKGRDNGADYILIAPRALLEAGEGLLDLRQRQGLRTRAVSLEEIAQEFGHGEARPEAIRDFLRYAYHFWTLPSLRYVLLLGDATYDPQDFLRTGVKDRIPAYMVKTPYMWTASDPAYAQVNGDDVLPDLAIGRLPAQTAEEANLMIEKILAFETGSQGLEGPAVLIADNPDLGGNFEADAEEVATLLADREVDRVYVRTLGTATRPAIQSAIDRGPSFVDYIGHGGINVWASENVWNNTDVPALAPRSRYHVLFTMNCLNGYFHFPPLNSLAEQFVKADGRGAVAAFSPSGLSMDEPANLYHRLLLGHIVSGSHRRLGDALLAAQSDYAAAGALPELLSIYHLFGDPAMSIR